MSYATSGMLEDCCDRCGEPLDDSVCGGDACEHERRHRATEWVDKRECQAIGCEYGDH